MFDQFPTEDEIEGAIGVSERVTLGIEQIDVKFEIGLAGDGEPDTRLDTGERHWNSIAIDENSQWRSPGRCLPGPGEWTRDAHLTAGCQLTARQAHRRGLASAPAQPPLSV